jgi:hypothetical protein
MKLMLALCIFLVLVQAASAITITKGVVFDPTESLASFTWDCIYEDDGSALIESTWFKVGGIKCSFNPNVELTVIIHEWNPENKNNIGKTVFDLTTISHQSGKFNATFENLPPNKKYSIYKNGDLWRTVTTDEDGVLEFYDNVDSSSRYVIKCGAPAQIPVPIQPPPSPGLETVFAIIGLAVTAWLLRKR